MDLMTRRRALLALVESEPGIDTSPMIAEYGKACALWPTGERDSESACVTEWYQFDPKPVGMVTLFYHMLSSDLRTDGNYQYYGVDESTPRTNQDWYYNISTSNPTRSIGWANYTLQEIRFTIMISDIDDVYAYCVQTGQIFFAGKNTPYYGYTNINDMPTGT